MFNNFFEEVARRQLTESASDRRRMTRQNRYYRKKGWITTYPNGLESLNVVKVHAHNLKRNTIMRGIVYPAAAILGITLSKMNRRN